MAREIYRRADVVARSEFGEGFDLKALEGVPLGVTSERPAEPALAQLFSTVLHLSFPDLIDLVEEGRASIPKLTNTDGHELLLLRVESEVADPAGLASALQEHADFRENSGGFIWLGREMTEMERETSLASAREFAEKQGAEISEGDKLHRWLRAHLELKGNRLSWM